MQASVPGAVALLLLGLLPAGLGAAPGYTFVGTGQTKCYDDRGELAPPKPGEPFFWTSTTHLEGPPDRQGGAAVYIAFGRALGWMQFPPGRGELRRVDVHGAGAQRSDPKAGDAADFPRGRGPQGDVIRIDNFVRCVRGGSTGP